MSSKILLTNTDRFPAAARVALRLSKAGFGIAAIHPAPGHPLSHIGAVEQSFRYSGLDPLGSLRKAIEAAKPELILPFDDRAVQHLHDLYKQVQSEGPPGEFVAKVICRSLGDPEGYARVLQRYELLQLAASLGLPVPSTGRIDGPEDLARWRENKVLPIVLKADGTWAGRGVRIAHTWQQAELALTELTAPTSAFGIIRRLALNRDRSWSWPWWKHSAPAITVQSHIAGRPANCGVACWQGRVLAGIAVEVVSSQGLKGPATVVRVVPGEEMLHCANLVAAALGLSGFFGLDFMIEEYTGKTYLIEMNPRSTPLTHLQLSAGRDLVGALCAQLSNELLPHSAAVTTDDRIAYFPQAYRSKSRFLENSFHDIPEEEPDLVRALLEPWSSRSLLGRMVDWARRQGDPAVASEEHEFTTEKELVCGNLSSPKFKNHDLVKR